MPRCRPSAPARDVFQKAIDEKLGDLNMTTVVKLFEKNN
jgi:hypothetical protein